MDFWERVARLLASKWIEDADPYDEAIAGKNCNVDSLVEWAAQVIENKLLGE